MSTVFASPASTFSRVASGRSAGCYSVQIPARVMRPAPTRATYRRRRVGAVAFAVTLVVSMGSMAQRGLADRGGDPASVAAVGQNATYVVRQGDTLWELAERFYPSAELGLVVDALISLNGGSAIQVGQLLNMP